MATIDRRIATADEVRALATEQEGETLDFKAIAHADQWWELAKDLAAFANHLGGVNLSARASSLTDCRSSAGFRPTRSRTLS